MSITAGRRIVSATVLAVLSACGGGADDNTGTATSSAAAEGDGSDRAHAQAILVPTITAQPVSQSVLTSARATFSVKASGLSLRYQWKRNGVAIAGATASSYTTPPVDYRDSAARYTVTVSGLIGSVTSQTATLNLTLSADQRLFEDFLMAGAYQVVAPVVSTTSSSTYSSLSTLSRSPLTNGPQTQVMGIPENLAHTLPLVPSIAFQGVLFNGRIVPASADMLTSQTNRVSYVGSDVKVENILPDGVTVWGSTLRRGFSVEPLAGPVVASPPDFAHAFDPLFANVSAYLRPSVSYAPGSVYMKYSAYQNGDRAMVVDCGATFVDPPAIRPCITGVPLVQAMTQGLRHGGTGHTYLLAEGTISTVLGVPMWVTNTITPGSSTRVAFFELDGNIHCAWLVRDGDRLNGSPYIVDRGLPTQRVLVDTPQIRLNRAARDSLAAALTF